MNGIYSQREKVAKIPAVPKKKYKRYKPTRKQRGRVNSETYNFVMERDNYTCVKCGRNGSFKDKHGFFLKMEVAHIENKSQGGTGQANDLALLCGPKVNSGTCHNWVDETREGKDWFRQWAKENLDDDGNYKG